jgi:signal transduction histidine kinase
MDGRWRAWATRRPLLADTALAVAAVAAELVLSASLPADMLPRDRWLAFAASLACALPIALRRVAPRVAIGVALLSLAAPFALTINPLTNSVAFVVLTYTAAARDRLPVAAATAAVLWVPVLVGNFIRTVDDIEPLLVALNNLLIALVSFFVGRTVHSRRDSTRALEERARVAESNQAALAAQAVADERRRIARELHDVVAHHVSVMGVLATGARRVLGRDPAAADEALTTIAETSRTTLREMRRLLDVLRTDAEPTEADLTPQPGLAGIEALVEQVREAGLPVSFEVEGVPGPLDPGVALTIYRIVQEALTNALKHAGTATAAVKLTFGISWLVVEVSDSGRGPRPRGAADDPDHVGHGLVGMRERVALYGGTLRTGPRAGGGFRVHARMPMEHLGAPGGAEPAGIEGTA